MLVVLISGQTSQSANNTSNDSNDLTTSNPTIRYTQQAHHQPPKCHPTQQKTIVNIEFDVESDCGSVENLTQIENIWWAKGSILQKIVIFGTKILINQSITILQTEISAAAFADTKPHYNILDGLRGVAALVVVWFHIFEAFATSHLDQQINHGYLAVDFFFILSGFVVGYAYDDRWGKMKVKDFLKRRFIRLHPMVVMGAIIGAIMFYTQGCSVWDVSKVSLGMLLLATLMNVFLIPATPGTEIRGVTEMYPLNGPSWSLFFEYIGNIIYAFFIRRLPTKPLAALVFIAGCGLGTYAIFGSHGTCGGDICVGFSMDGTNMIGGSLRLMFAFSAGLLLCRIFKPINIKGAFWIGSLALIALLAVPRIGGSEHLWANGLYDTLCVVVAFPIIVYMGASGKTTDKTTTRICKFLGDISYPLYMVHYPFIYLYYAWVKNDNLTFTQSLPGALALFFGSILLAYLCLKLYDEPVRKFLSKHLLRRKAL